MNPSAEGGRLSGLLRVTHTHTHTCIQLSDWLRCTADGPGASGTHSIAQVKRALPSCCSSSCPDWQAEQTCGVHQDSQQRCRCPQFQLTASLRCSPPDNHRRRCSLRLWLTLRARHAHVCSPAAHTRFPASSRTDVCVQMAERRKVCRSPRAGAAGRRRRRSIKQTLSEALQHLNKVSN